MKRSFRLAKLTSLLLAATIATMGQSAPASAEAFWLGLRSDDWNDGIENGISNWYDEPSLAGTVQQVPRDTAIFANGAINFTTVVRQFTDIKRIRIEAGAPVYSFRVDPEGFLHLRGAGITNQSNNTQLLTILKDGGVTLHEKAKIVGAGGVRSVSVFNFGIFLFLGKSKGGDAIVTNDGGSVTFTEQASADGMFITNQNHGTVGFSEKSKADFARISNLSGTVSALVDKGSVLRLLSLSNSDRLIIRSDVIISEIFSQSQEGRMSFNIGAKVPSIRINGQANINGELRILADKKTKPGVHKIIVANVRVGKFKKLTFDGPDKLKVSLSYPGNDVVLSIEAK